MFEFIIYHLTNTHNLTTPEATSLCEANAGMVKRARARYQHPSQTALMLAGGSAFCCFMGAA